MGRVTATAETLEQRREAAALTIARGLTAGGASVSHLAVWAALRRGGDDCSPSEAWRALMAATGEEGPLVREPVSGYFRAPKVQVPAL